MGTVTVPHCFLAIPRLSFHFNANRRSGNPRFGVSPQHVIMRLKTVINESVDRTSALHKTEHEHQMSVLGKRTMIAPRQNRNSQLPSL